MRYLLLCIVYVVECRVCTWHCCSVNVFSRYPVVHDDDDDDDGDVGSGGAPTRKRCNTPARFRRWGGWFRLGDGGRTDVWVGLCDILTTIAVHCRRWCVVVGRLLQYIEKGHWIERHYHHSLLAWPHGWDDMDCLVLSQSEFYVLSCRLSCKWACVVSGCVVNGWMECWWIAFMLLYR